MLFVPAESLRTMTEAIFAAAARAPRVRWRSTIQSELSDKP